MNIKETSDRPINPKHQPIHEKVAFYKRLGLSKIDIYERMVRDIERENSKGEQPNGC